MKHNKNSMYDFNYLGGYETQEQIDWNLKYNSPNIGSLHGPDNPNQAPYQDEQQYEPTTLNSPDDYLHPVKTPANKIVKTLPQSNAVNNITGIRKTGTVGMGGGGVPESGVLVHTTGDLTGGTGTLHTGTLLLFGVSGDPAYAFSGYIPEDVLNRYLDREIDMPGLFWWSYYYYDNSTGGHGQFPADSFDTSTHALLTLKPAGSSAQDPRIRIYINPASIVLGGPLVNMNLPPSSGPYHPPYFINIADETPGGGKDYFINNILTTSGVISSTSPFQVQQDMAMLANLKPKIIAAATIYSFVPPYGAINPQRPDTLPIGPSDDPVQWICTYSKMIIDYYHFNIDADAIFQGFIYEGGDSSFNQINIPNYVLEEFGFCGFVPIVGTGGAIEYIPFCPGGSLILHTDHLGAVSSFFDYESMHYLSTISWKAGYDANHMDITRIETQMWLYFIATKYIDSGFESIFFGDTFTMVWNDGPDYNSSDYTPSTTAGNGYSITWQLMQKVRAYAAAHARRSTVICMGTAPDSFYHDPTPGAPYPTWRRQLILDAHRNKMPLVRRNSTVACYNGNGNSSDGGITYAFGTDLGPTYQSSVYPQQINATHFKDDIVIAGGTYHVDWTTHILYDNQGGLHPQGWFCLQAPFWIGFDGFFPNGSHYWGCAFPTPSDWYGYGYYRFGDNEWFALQNKPTRDKLIQYIYFRLKCINPYTHFEMLGRTNLYANWHYDHIDHTAWYRANDGGTGYVYDQNLTGKFGQETIIKEIWNGLIPVPNTWKHHNFTFENVSNAATRVLDIHGITTITLTDVQASSSLVFVGDDKVYFIGANGYIHGYIKVSNNVVGGTWLTVSPTYSAEIFYGQAVSTQVKAQSDLVASTDGTMLYYIGIDNYIYGFYINNVWEYEYVRYIQELMHANSITALGSVIAPFSNSLYFIAVGGLIYCVRHSGSSTWEFSLARSAHDNYGQSYASQEQAARSLTYDSSSNKIYYCGIDGFLHYYKVQSFTTDRYEYYDFEGDSQLYGLRVSSNLCFWENRIYFIGLNNSTGTKKIYCIKNISGTWYLVNLADEASTLHGTPYNHQALAIFSDRIAVSPDGSKIAYFGRILASAAFGYIAYYNFLGGGTGNDYTFNTFSVDYTVDGAENSLQFTDNNDLYFIGNANNTTYDKTVQLLKFEPDNCGQADTIIEGLWPLP